MYELTFITWKQFNLSAWEVVKLFLSVQTMMYFLLEGDDAERELVDGEEDISDAATVPDPDLNESHEDDEHRAAERKVKSGKHDISVEEGDIGAEEGEYAIDVAKDSKNGHFSGSDDP